MKGIARGARTRHLNGGRPQTRELWEYSESKPERVDKEAGIIFGVKLLGQTSRNTHGVRGVDETRYTDAALREAAALYEGLPVNYDHAPKNERGEVRRTSATGGIVQGVQFKPGQGLIGNLKMLKAHERFGPLVEAAASPDMNHLFACSHHAYGRSSVQGRTLVVDKIPDPRSVDIVTAGGTVRGLFEEQQGRQTMKTIREILESLVAKLKGKSKPRLKALLEADVLPESDAEMEAPADEAEPEEQMEDALEAAICAVVRKLFDGETDVKGALSKIKEIFKAHASITGEEGGDDEEPADDDDEPADKKVDESLREKAQKDPAVRKLLESHEKLTAKLATDERKAKNRKLLEAAKLPATALTKGFLELVEDADSDKELKRLIENQREAIGVGRPKSAGSHQGANMGGGSLTGKEAVAAFSQQVRGF